MTLDIEALKARLAKLQEKSSGGGRGASIWWKPTKDPTLIRGVPNPHNPKQPFISAWWHYDIGGVKTIYCPKMNEGKECPICDLADKFRTMGGDDNYKIFNQFKAKNRLYLPMIVRGEDPMVVRLWGFTPAVERELLSYIVNPDWGNFADPYEGHDVTVASVPSGKEVDGKPIPMIDLKFKPATTPLIPGGNKVATKKFLDAIPNFVEDPRNFTRKTTEELHAILSKLDGSSEEEEIEEEVDEPRPRRRSSSVDDKLEADLDEAFDS